MLGGSVPKLNCVSAGYKRFHQPNKHIFVLVSLHSNAIVANIKIESDDGQCKKFATEKTNFKIFLSVILFRHLYICTHIYQPIYTIHSRYEHRIGQFRLFRFSYTIIFLQRIFYSQLVISKCQRLNGDKRRRKFKHISIKYD